MALAYINNVTANRAAFAAKVQVIATLLAVPPDWLMIVMYVESRLNPRAKNPTSTATGLIQFLESTARSLGTTTADLRNMSNLAQLDYVYKYYKPYAGKMKTIYDCYFAVFYPKAIGQSDNYVLFRKGQSAYSANAALDVDKSGAVTVEDVKKWFGRNIPQGVQGGENLFNNSFQLAGMGLFIGFITQKLKTKNNSYGY